VSKLAEPGCRYQQRSGLILPGMDVQEESGEEGPQGQSPEKEELPDQPLTLDINTLSGRNTEMKWFPAQRLSDLLVDVVSSLGLPWDSYTLLVGSEILDRKKALCNYPHLCKAGVATATLIREAGPQLRIIYPVPVEDREAGFTTRQVALHCSSVASLKRQLGQETGIDLTECKVKVAFHACDGVSAEDALFTGLGIPDGTRAHCFGNARWDTGRRQLTGIRWVKHALPNGQCYFEPCGVLPSDACEGGAEPVAQASPVDGKAPSGKGKGKPPPLPPRQAGGKGARVVAGKGRPAPPPPHK